VASTVRSAAVATAARGFGAGGPACGVPKANGGAAPEPEGARGRLPTVVATSVIRLTHRGQSHGGVYLVDLETREVEQVIDWNTCAIDWEGRGRDRGLRGVAFHDGRVLLAASNEVLVFDRRFRQIDSVRCRYLKWCHEIYVHGDVLYMTSTGFDAILRFDLRRWRFLSGICFRSFAPGAISLLARRALRRGGLLLRPIDGRLYRCYLGTLRAREFDPHSTDGPRLADLFHINNVLADDDGIDLCGTMLDGLYRLRDGRLERLFEVPLGTHNTRLIDGAAIYQDTERDRVSLRSLNGGPIEHYPLPRYPRECLENADLRRDHDARAGFGRGLCLAPDGLIIAGSAPATITVFRRGRPTPLRSINLTLDVCSAIHGLEVWPSDRDAALAGADPTGAEVDPHLCSARHQA
jgi:hypothetical protein